MSDDLTMPDAFSLSFWMDGAENGKLGRAAHAWFSLLGRAAFWGPLSQEPLTCGEQALELIAWQRGIRRFAAIESERLYRLRVHHAYENAADAGSVTGWKRIFERLELLADPDDLKLLERFEWVGIPQDWDVIGIALSDERLAELQAVIERIIIEEYGRTCRRYQLVSKTEVPVYVGGSLFHDDHCTMEARVNTDFGGRVRPGLAAFDNDHATMGAAWASA